MARTRPAAFAAALVAVLTACGGDPEPVASTPATTPAPSVTPMLPGATETTPTEDAGAPSREPADVLADVEVTGITGDTPFEQEAIAVLRTYFGEFAVAQASNDTTRPELAAVVDPMILANLTTNIGQQATDGEYVVGPFTISVLEANELSSGTDVLVEMCADGRERVSYDLVTDDVVEEAAEAQDLQVLVSRTAAGTVVSQLALGQPGLCDRAGAGSAPP